MAASCENLIVWLNTLGHPEPIESIQDLSNGVILSKILKSICPKTFNDNWQSKIKGDASNNWRIKASNLKKVLRGILDYYLQDLQMTLPESQLPDVNIIAEKDDEREMGKLLKLLLGCAVNCDHKQEYIQKIMSLEESVQHSVMVSIKELMLTETSQENDVHQAASPEEYKKLSEERNSLEQRCHELDQQLLILSEEKQNLRAENERLNHRLNQVDILEDPRHWRDWGDHFASTPVGRRLQHLQKQVDHLQDELFRSEAARDDYRIRCEILEKDMKQLQSKNEALGKLTEDARMMKDELDILRHNSDKVAKYEATISNLKKKLEDLSDLKGQVRLFEEKNSSYVERNLELEEELKKTSVFRGQLEVYKRQNHDLQLKLSEESMKADKYEIELARQQEKINGLQMEKERLIEERDSLKEISEELKIMQMTASAAHSLGLDGDSDSDGLELLGVPPHVRERMMKMRHELKILKLSGNSSSEDLEVYKNLLEDANKRKDELEMELRSQSRKVLELQAVIEDLREMNKQQQQQNSSSNSPSSLSSASSPFSRTNEPQCIRTLDKARATADDDKMKQEFAEVSKKLREKEEEMKQMEQKYKLYLEKAKVLINHHQQKSVVPADVALLEERLAEKENLIQALENQLKAHEKEEKLMLSAFYSLSISIHKRNVEDRLAKGCSSVPHSFLSRQRQVQSRRASSGISSSPHFR